jgi:argininosuccinate lyase
MIAGMKVNDGVSRDQRYAYMYSVEEVNRLVVDGVPFRDAYKRVGLEIERGEFTPDYNISHTHEGSIGNLCNDRIRARFDNVLAQFNFADYHAAFSRLIND